MAILRAVLAKRRTRRVTVSVSSECEHGSGKTGTDECCRAVFSATVCLVIRT